jgi:hypothetical protein
MGDEAITKNTARWLQPCIAPRAKHDIFEKVPSVRYLTTKVGIKQYAERPRLNGLKCVVML